MIHCSLRYAFKLLGSPSTTLRPVLISLWAKILAEDPKVKADLLKVSFGLLVLFVDVCSLNHIFSMQSAASPVRSRSAGSGNWKAYNYFVSTVSSLNPHVWYASPTGAPLW